MHSHRPSKGRYRWEDNTPLTPLPVKTIMSSHALVLMHFFILPSQERSKVQRKALSTFSPSLLQVPLLLPTFQGMVTTFHSHVVQICVEATGIIYQVWKTEGQIRRLQISHVSLQLFAKDPSKTEIKQ